MIFPFATFFIAVLALGQTALAGLTPPQVVVNINIVATISNNANNALVPLSITSSPNQVKTIGVSLKNSFQQIINELNADITAMSATAPFTDNEAEQVVAALTTFIQIHQTLLGTVIGKHGLFAQFGVTAPIAAILRGLEGAVDGFAFSMINLIPTKAPMVQTGAGQLSGTLTTAQNTYEQICIPNPLYPRLMPICADLGL